MVKYCKVIRVIAHTQVSLKKKTSQINKGLTYFDKKICPVFFSYFMKYYFKFQNCMNFKITKFYKMMCYLKIKKFPLVSKKSYFLKTAEKLKI